MWSTVVTGTLTRMQNFPRQGLGKQVRLDGAPGCVHKFENFQNFPSWCGFISSFILANTQVLKRDETVILFQRKFSMWWIDTFFFPFFCPKGQKI
jgi:hypothetical protein